jgi:hypothetical protein
VVVLENTDYVASCVDLVFAQERGLGERSERIAVGRDDTLDKIGRWRQRGKTKNWQRTGERLPHPQPPLLPCR